MKPDFSLKKGPSCCGLAVVFCGFISHLIGRETISIPEIFSSVHGFTGKTKFENSVKYANEMADDVIHSTQYYLKYINGDILANLQRRSLKLGRLIVLYRTHLRL